MDRVLVQRIKAETKTAGGIFLPESSVKELNEAKVLAVGPGALSKDGSRVPMGVAQGDRVLIPQVSLVRVMAVGLMCDLISHGSHPQTQTSCSTSFKTKLLTWNDSVWWFACQGWR